MTVFRAGLLCLLTACASSGPRPSAPPAAQAAPAQLTPAQATLASASRASRKATIQGALAQNVRVVVTNDDKPVRSASGVVVANGISPEGALSYIVTNAHVVAPRAGETPRFVVLIDLPTGDTQEFGGRLLAVGKVPEEDLAVIAILGVALEPAALADEQEVGVGEEVFVVAAPFGRDLSVSGGMVSRVDFDRKPPRTATLIKTDAAIGYGASGGGLFSMETGKLIGIVEGYRTAKVSFPVNKETFSFDVPMPGETFASPVGKLRRFLARMGLEAGQSGVAASAKRE